MTQDPNQPGDDGYSAEGYDASGFDPNAAEERENVTLGTAAPAVAAPQNRMVIILMTVVVIATAVVWLLFSGGEKGPTKEELERQQQAVNVAPVVQAPEALPEATAPLEPTQPDLEQAKLPPLPLPPEELVKDDVAITPPEDPAVAEARKKAEEDLRQRRLRSGMVIGGMGSALSRGLEKTGNVSSADMAPSKDGNLSFERSTEKESTPVIVAERISDLRTSIIQGKIISVVLESALNTDLPAPIRAIVSRDVYAESGKTILIPKGSRVIGKYNTDILRGQKRIFVIWQRVLRPDGVSIAIASPGVDQIGRGGVEGVVDNKYLEVYSAAILTSMVTIGAAVGSDQIVEGQVSTSNNSLDGSTTTGTAGATAVQQSITDLGDSTRRVVDGLINLRPTITLDQGTRMNIFVNRDVTFPPGVQGGAAVIVQ